MTGKLGKLENVLKRGELGLSVSVSLVRSNCRGLDDLRSFPTIAVFSIANNYCGFFCLGFFWVGGG